MGNSKRIPTPPLPEIVEQIEGAGFASAAEMYEFLMERGRRYFYARHVRDWDVAEDLAHEAILAFWRQLSTTFKPVEGTVVARQEASVRFYFGIVHKLRLQCARRIRTQERAKASMAAGGERVTPSALATMVRNEELTGGDVIRSTIESMPEGDDRLILQLRFLDGLSFNAIMQLLHRPLGTLHSQANRATQVLRAKLEREHPGLFH